MATASRDCHQPVLWDFLVVASTVCRAVWALHQDESVDTFISSLPSRLPVGAWHRTLLAPSLIDDGSAIPVLAACAKVGLDLSLHLDRLASAHIDLVAGRVGAESIANVWSLVDVSVLKYRLDGLLARLKSEYYSEQ